MKNRIKSVFLSDKFISNFKVFNNIKITCACMRTSGETERVQSVSYPHKRSLSR